MAIVCSCLAMRRSQEIWLPHMHGLLQFGLATINSAIYLIDWLHQWYAAGDQNAVHEHSH